MKFYKLLASLLVSIALIVLNLGNVAYSQSLQEALGLAYINNPTLNAERAGVRAVKKTKAQAIARFLPTYQQQQVMVTEVLISILPKLRLNQCTLI